MIPYTLPQTSLANTGEIAPQGAEKADSVRQLLAGAEPVSTLPGLDMTQYALVCFGLVALILVLGWLTKRFLAGNLRARANQRAMKVVDVLPLGGKRQLAVVRCYDRTFVLGLGEKDVNLVTELDPDEDVEGVLAPATPQAAPKPAAPKLAFGNLVRRALERKQPAPAIKEEDFAAAMRATLAADPTPAPPAPRPAQPAPAPRDTAEQDNDSYTGLGPGLLG